jgi:hypothetical protein
MSARVRSRCSAESCVGITSRYEMLLSLQFRIAFEEVPLALVVRLEDEG